MKPAHAFVGGGFALVAVVIGLRLTEVSRGVAAAERALAKADLVAAEAEWRSVLAVEPESVDALYGLGWTLHLGGREDLARDVFLRCVEQHPDSPLGYKGLGSVAMAEGNTPAARRRFAEALERSPADRAVLHSMALLELATGDGAAAVTAFQALVDQEPSRSAFRQGLAEAQILAATPGAAIVTADEAIRVATDDRARAQAWLTRGRAVLAEIAGRLDPEDCGRTAPVVHAWLDDADRSLDEAEATGVPLPELVATRRLVRQRRGLADDDCPGTRALGREFPDG